MLQDDKHSFCSMETALSASEMPVFYKVMVGQQVQGMELQNNSLQRCSLAAFALNTKISTAAIPTFCDLRQQDRLEHCERRIKSSQ